MSYYTHKSVTVDHGEQFGKTSRGLDVLFGTIRIHNENSAARIVNL
jgi:hypothetical protein